MVFDDLGAGNGALRVDACEDADGLSRIANVVRLENVARRFAALKAAIAAGRPSSGTELVGAGKHLLRLHVRLIGAESGESTSTAEASRQQRK